MSIVGLRKAGAPDGVEAPVGKGDHQVDVDDEVDDEVDVDPDVHVGCDMPMSIYSQYFSSHFVSKLLRSKFSQVSFKLVKDYKDFQRLNSDVKSLYFIQSAYTIYLCMSMVIYLFYLLLKVVNSDYDS